MDIFEKIFLGIIIILFAIIPMLLCLLGIGWAIVDKIKQAVDFFDDEEQEKSVTPTLNKNNHTPIEGKNDINVTYCSICGQKIDKCNLYCTNCGCNTKEHHPTKDKPQKDKQELSQEQEIKALFTASYLSLFKRIHSKFESASMELLPYLYVVFDIAAIDSGYDRYKMKDIVFEFINNLLKDEEKSGQDDEEIEQVISWIYSRVDIYGKVVRGYRPKGMMFLTDKSLVNSDNAICRCTVMLSDILLDDDFFTVEEYEHLPFIVCDIFEAMENSALISEVAVASVKSHNMVYEIIKRR